MQTQQEKHHHEAHAVLHPRPQTEEINKGKYISRSKEPWRGRYYLGSSAGVNHSNSSMFVIQAATTAHTNEVRRGLEYG